MRRNRPKLLVVTLAALTAGFVACDLPRDPEGTLADVRGDELRVGVSEAPPWVTKPAAGDAPGGVEADLVRRLAEHLDADVRWVWGTPVEHVEALRRFELHLAIGGHTRGSPLVRHAGATNPWLVTADRHGRTELRRRQHVLLVPPGENAWLLYVEGRLRADSTLIEARTRRARRAP